MTDAKAGRIRTNYSELKKFVDNQNYAKVVKIANKILAESDSEEKAWQCKITALIHLGEFNEALQSLKKCKVVECLLFEKAYCEYRSNDIQAAWNTVSRAPANSSPRIKELQAQILYRLERYEDCYTIYRELVKSTSDEFDQERLTNLSAVVVHRVADGSLEKGPKPSSDASYEQLYNSGCELLGRGHVSEAMKRLQEAEALCKSILTQQEGATDEEVNEEVAVIRVQQGYCLQLLGREKEALTLYNAVLKTKPDDPALLAVINNNIVAINREGNVFDSKKRLKTTIAPGLEHKLTSHQRGSIAVNHCLMAYYTNQDELCESEANQIFKKFPRYSMAAAIITAAQLGRAGKLDEAAKVLKSHANKEPSNALVTLLSAAQILLTQGSIEPTLELLASLKDSEKYRNGIVSALVVLFSAIKQNEKVSKILREAVDWHKQNKSSVCHLSDLLRHSSNFHLRNKDPRAAAACLEELRRLDSSDKNTLAQLISAYSQFDSVMAQNLSKELPDSSSLVVNLDAEALEASFGQKYTRKAQGKDIGDISPASPKARKIGTPSTDTKEKQKQKKKRKVKLPKNLIEGEEPDPERWLPRWQRKGYKKKRDRRNKDVMKGTQGVSSDAADKFDISKTAGQQKSSSVSSPQTESGYKRNQQKKKGGKKKKGQW